MMESNNGEESGLLPPRVIRRSKRACVEVVQVESQETYRETESTTTKRSKTRASIEKEETRRNLTAQVNKNKKLRRNRIVAERKALKQEKPVSGNGSEAFYEIEKVVGKRIRNGRAEYLIRWKGCDEEQDSFEPEVNLSDTAFAEATLYEEKQQMLETQEKKGRRLLGIDGQRKSHVLEEEIVESLAGAWGDEADEDIQSKESTKQAVASAPNDREISAWDWLGAAQVDFREVARIAVNENGAGARVSEARENGIPVVLVGHTGWTDFARRWLKEEDRQSNETSETDNAQAKQEPPSAEAMAEEVDDREDCCSLLDVPVPVSLPNTVLDIPRMMEDIGQEMVPVVKRDYNEASPIAADIKVETFLRNCESDFSAVNSESPAVAGPKLYLHQWQFTLSDTAGKKLCHQNNPLPNDIMGEDLLKHLVGNELPHCKGDSPLQYLFMGAAGTMSKLHQDRGGLAISIAPIVGEKECVLVHRYDGAACLYNLEAPLERIDLHQFPLMSMARMWKTTIRPGEILLMPQGTYHQCRNLTACLSYSRFHLDTVNIRAFLQSMFDGDAQEIDHGKIIWHAADDILDKVYEYIEEFRAHMKNPRKHGRPCLSADLIRMEETLRCLRHVCREIARRKDAKIAAKGQPMSFEVPAGFVSGEGPSLGLTGILQHTNGGNKAKYDWNVMTGVIDKCLLDFQYCDKKRLREYSARPVEIPHTDTMVREGDVVIARCGSELEDAFLRLPSIPLNDLDMARVPEYVDPSVGDTVTIHLLRRYVKGHVLQVEHKMDAALLSYEMYPAVYDEYMPYDRLRIPISGEASADVKAKDVRPGLMVLCKYGSTGEEYQAQVLSTVSGTFYKVWLPELGKKVKIERWFTEDSIVKVFVAGEAEALSTKSMEADIVQSNTLKSKVLESAPAVIVFDPRQGDSSGGAESFEDCMTSISI